MGGCNDDGAWLGVSRWLCYVGKGDALPVSGGRPDRQIKLLLTSAAWVPHRRDDIEIVGLDGCIEMLIAPDPPTA